MSAEIAKLRYLQFPRVTLAAVVGVTLLIGALLLVLEPESADSYQAIPAVAVGIAFQIGAIVFGVWVGTLEFASGTIQRTLTADPVRGRVLRDKLILVIVAVAITGLAVAAISVGLSDLAARRADVPFSHGDGAGSLLSIIPSGIAGAVVGFGLGLLTRSMGGGITATFALVFVLDGAIGMLPAVGDWTFGELTTDLQHHLEGERETNHGPALAALGTLAWCVALTLPGWLSFTRGDLK
jgi:ABC-2 type transport system permease protein